MPILALTGFVVPLLINAYLAGTTTELVFSVGKMRFATELGISYKSFIRRINSVRPI